MLRRRAQTGAPKPEEACVEDTIGAAMGIVAIAVDNGVVAGAAEQRILARTAENQVVAVIAVDVVVAAAAGQLLVAVGADDDDVMGIAAAVDLGALDECDLDGPGVAA